MAMADHIKALQQAREQVVNSRRKMAEQMSNPYNPRLEARTTFIEIQNTIDQIDKAIKDEEELASRGAQVEERPEGFSRL